MKKEINIDVLNNIYRELSDLIGVEGMLKLHEEYRGMQISFPTHLYDRELAAKEVAENKGVESTRKLAQKYGYSERWVQNIMTNLKR